MRNADRTSVITCFVTKDDRVLLLQRSGKVGTYRARWAGVSGYLEVEDAAEQCRIELEEELGLGIEDAILEVTGQPLEVVDPKNARVWLVHPFRFALRQGVTPRLDWEHVAMRWVDPQTIQDMDTVPGLWEAWLRVSNSHY